ncbi:glycosyltransferase involved in cell wall biosynthesis [Rhodoblastus acidophilus]|uniref:glycosyltransferase family 2 protein n=1 Tax=Rhodoblastus acidophilus TaxID=1074 RepID=UPI002225049D|nr:glycosyltransferase family 2 protein [Rhodoblastus acidophilus]MCW2284297.1 glycosyltransferase involved in cell wall biosynthesis [Rhodoblastus acidophilus]MCW2333225.1 glycosyltransferase involved in cell wall biosynthesis [Rhodoblastus acidophilus]
MTQRPTLSLLIPAYNAARFLPRILESAHRQTVPFDEIWVYDDFSSDDTAAVAVKYGAKVLRGEVNKGCSAGKQALARHVDADWVHFHDADDELLPNFVSLARKWIDADNRDAVLFAYEYRDEESGALLAVSTFDDAALRADPRRYAITRQINPFCGLYRRERMLAAGGYALDPKTLYNEDVAFHIRMAFAGLTFAAEDEVSIINWRIAGSMSGANPVRCAIAHFHVLTTTLALPGATAYHVEIAAKLWANAGILAALGEWSIAKAAVQLAASLGSPPATAGKPWFRALASINPVAALAAREAAIRLLKPQLRRRSA